ncbi:MAG: phosphodiesterase [Succinivibrio sp.]|nr:phosphodiesterase [Succinivibrio sp.]
MHYLVLSDIHGGIDELRQALSFRDKLNCDAVILLGDLLNHGPRNRIPSSYQPPLVAQCLNDIRDQIISIRGNCDSEVDGMLFDFPCNAPYGYVWLDAVDGRRKVFLTHGHLHPCSTPEQQRRLGLGPKDVVLSGHTHVSGIFPQEGGVVNINPGSTTLPKGGSQAGFATLTEEGVFLYNLSGQNYASYQFGL